MAPDSAAGAGHGDPDASSGFANSAAAAAAAAPSVDDDVANAADKALEPASSHHPPLPLPQQQLQPQPEQQEQRQVTPAAHSYTPTPPPTANPQPTAASSGPGQASASTAASTAVSTPTLTTTATPPASTARTPITVTEAIHSAAQAASPHTSPLNGVGPTDVPCSYGPSNNGDDGDDEDEYEDDDQDDEMSDYPLLLGRSAAAPASSSHPPSQSASHVSGSPAQPASSTASPAHHHHSPSHSSSTPPPNQLLSYSMAPISQHPPDAQRLAHINGSSANSIGNNVTLPSMRTIDAMAHQSAAAPLLQHGMSGHTPSSSTSAQPYYTHTAASATGLHTELSQRYPLPHDHRLPATRASKKEIKRRTKTGCLTCRKRRIKCDEAHPTCNNCKKSKRDCLGYDPIFRQQSAVQPSSSLQPAPSPTTSHPSSSSPVSVAGTAHHLNNAYVNQPPISSCPSNSTPPPAAVTSISATTNPANPVYSHSSHTTPTPLPPSLPVKTEIYNLPPVASAPTAPIAPTAPTAPRPYQTSIAFDPARHIDQVNPPPDHSLLPSLPSKMKVIDIINSMGPNSTPPVSADAVPFSEIVSAYHEVYAYSLAAFFESSWYCFSDNGVMSFPKHPPLIESMASFIEFAKSFDMQDESLSLFSGHVETKIVWELSCAVYLTPERSNAAMRVQLPPQDDSAEARSRLQVVEALLSGEYLPNNPLSPPVADANDERTRQFDFWYNLADFVRQRDSPESHQAKQAREDILGRMRRLLDSLENRDVLYSIAVARHLSPHYAPSYLATETEKQPLDETDPQNRLAFAAKFIRDQSKTMGGTTTVVCRFCDIAYRAFLNPGWNLERST